MRLLSVTSWPVWALPSRLLSYVLFTELLAAFLGVYCVFTSPAPSFPQWIFAASCTLGGAVLYRTQKVLGVRADVEIEATMEDIWLLAACLLLPLRLLPLPLLGLLASFTLTHFRPVVPDTAGVLRARDSDFFKHVWNTSSLFLTCFVAWIAAHLLTPWGFVPAALGAFLAYNLMTNLLAAVIPTLFSSRWNVLPVFVRMVRDTDHFPTLAAGALATLLAASTHVALALPLLAIPVAGIFLRGTLYQPVLSAARKDPKTGLASSEYWTTRAQLALTASLDAAKDLALVVVDLDHFKRVNDTFGHTVGDEVLKTVAARLSATVRTTDLVGRFGGEEFVVLLPSTPLPEALALAERLRLAISSHPVTLEDGSSLPITASLGVASATSATPALRALLDSADAALYGAKDAGRNCVVSA